MVVELAIYAKTKKQLKEIVETNFYFSYRGPFPGATDPRNAKGIGRRSLAMHLLTQIASGACALERAAKQSRP